MLQWQQLLGFPLALVLVQCAAKLAVPGQQELGLAVIAQALASPP
jgi:predicted phosphoribosyltransferase